MWTLLASGEQPRVQAELKLWWCSFWWSSVKTEWPLTILRIRMTGAFVVMMLFISRLCRVGGRFLRERCLRRRCVRLLIRFSGHTVMRVVS